MAKLYLDTKDLKAKASLLCAYDEVYLTGTIYTARDAAHKRLLDMLEKGEKLPFELEGAVIYYAGPTPERPGALIGSCGPTTSSRMDAFTPTLLKKGLCGMIGKGPRNIFVTEAIKKAGAIYFCAIGGAGALAAMCVKKNEVIAFEDLGCESIKRLYVEKFPLICAIDSRGESVFSCQNKQYYQEEKQ